MILAIILLSSFSSGALNHAGVSLLGQSDGQSASTPSADHNNPQVPAAAPPSAPPNSSNPETGKPKAPRKSASVRKKKANPPDCNAGTSSGSTGSASASTETSPSADGHPGAQAQTQPPNCPPKKVIVRQGGTTEPSIQLEGGIVEEQASQQKESTNQILGTTEQNLKKLDGRQLTGEQQSMMSQARQFVDQSRTAMNAGDFDRARTLAWKAQLLSRDLIGPDK